MCEKIIVAIKKEKMFPTQQQQQQQQPLFTPFLL